MKSKQITEIVRLICFQTLDWVKAPTDMPNQFFTLSFPDIKIFILFIENTSRSVFPDLSQFNAPLST